MESTYYQLEEALVQGFQSPEEYQAYQELKEHYEEATGDYTFSKRELTSQLEIALQEHRGVDFEDHEKEDYLELVQKLEEFDSKEAAFYRRMVD
ncbi:hypothetical protein DW726_05020 [Streptococcus gordonii]|uniref:DUF5962 family protein n=1 Tax=Streptococcus gordonii TaxID=1302 RepID=UPI000E522499|nr:DUF5962 family protein [Streptococcus gordonii]RHE64454.1 hypothetical protein DW726_05020 [Streptococcus gordonii]